MAPAGETGVRHEKHEQEPHHHDLGCTAQHDVLLLRSLSASTDYPTYTAPGVLVPARSAGATSNRTVTVHGPRAAVPEDRYAMAGGCYALRSSGGGYAVRKDTGFAATGEYLKDAEPFHFQATDLGRYLLFGSLEDFLAASEGLAGEVAFIGPVNEAAGGGSSGVAAATPSELADWKVTGTGNVDSRSLFLPRIGLSPSMPMAC